MEDHHVEGMEDRHMEDRRSGGPRHDSGDDALAAEHARPLREADAHPDPLVQFGRWYEDARALVRLPEAMAVATANAAGQVSVRMVLLKQWDDRGLVFHTNFGSRKGRDLAENPVAALLFHWDPLGRQVRIEGAVERISASESDDYFATRPFGAQVGAVASHQSEPIASREELDARVLELTRRLRGTGVTRPSWWGGLRVRPATWEFWQNREDRLHDRLRYVLDGTAWRVERLQP